MSADRPRPARASDDYARASAQGVRALCGVDLRSTSAPRWSAACAPGPSAAARPTSPTTATRCARTPAELDAFLDRVTINVSHLWRHEDQWERAARTTSCPSSPRAAAARWSAGCSYGAEAYTIAAVCPRGDPARPRRDPRHRPRQAHGRARPRAASSPPRTPAPSPPRDAASALRAAPTTAAGRPRPSCSAMVRFDTGDLLRMPARRRATT